MIPKSQYVWVSIAFVVLGVAMSLAGGTFYGSKVGPAVGWVSGWAGITGNLSWLLIAVSLYCFGVYDGSEDRNLERYRKIGCLFLFLAIVPIVIALTWGIRSK